MNVMICQIIVSSVFSLLTIAASTSVWRKYFTGASIGTNTTHYSFAISITNIAIASLLYISSLFLPMYINYIMFFISINIASSLLFMSRFSITLNLKYKRWYSKNKKNKITTSNMNKIFSIINASTPFILILLIILLSDISLYNKVINIYFIIFTIMSFINIPYIGIYKNFKLSLISMATISVIKFFGLNLYINVIHGILMLFLISSYSVLALNMYLFNKDDPLS